MLVVGALMLTVIVVYDFRFSYFGIPYDWNEIRHSGYIRAAVLEGDTLFERQIRDFAASQKLDCFVKYCSYDDLARINLLMLDVDVIKTHDTPKEYSWHVRENSTILGDSLEVWYDRNVRQISCYDALFRHYGDSIGWDWKLLAAIGYVESRFKNVFCPSGLGVMQLSSVIARRFGAPDAMVCNPRHNIRAAACFISYMDEKYGDIEDETERRKFII